MKGYKGKGMKGAPARGAGRRMRHSSHEVGGMMPGYQPRQGGPTPMAPTPMGDDDARMQRRQRMAQAIARHGRGGRPRRARGAMRPRRGGSPFAWLG